MSKEDLTPQCFEQALRNIPGGWILKKEERLNNAILDVIRGVLDPEILIVPDSTGQDSGTVTRAQESEIRRSVTIGGGLKPKVLALLGDDLPPEAESLVDNFSVRLVRGVAGSGKTLVLARRAQYLAKRYPEFRILVMTYNVDLTDDLKRRISDAQNVEVTNFHKVCSHVLGKKWRSPAELKGWFETYASALLSELQLPADFVAEEIAYRKDMELYDHAQYLEVERQGRGQALTKAKREIINRIFDQYVQYQFRVRSLDWSDVPRLALAELQPGHPLRNCYDVILIDEAQDFAPSWMKVVKALLKSTGELFVCDDPTQSIFRFTTWRQKGIEVTGRTRLLRVPFRNTQTISQAAHSLIAADSILSQSAEITAPDLNTYELPIGETPILVECENLEQEVEFVKQKVLSLRQKGIAPEHIAILCHDKRLVEYWAELSNQGIYVASFWKMKGLEFKAVLLPHLQTAFKRDGMILDEAAISEVRRRLFTGMTRARETLIMSYHGNLPAELSAIEPHVQRQHISSIPLVA